jgi:hypothetical protein
MARGTNRFRTEPEGDVDMQGWEEFAVAQRTKE